jgi:hypothetical protein
MGLRTNGWKMSKLDKKSLLDIPGESVLKSIRKERFFSPEMSSGSTIITCVQWRY